MSPTPGRKCSAFPVRSPSRRRASALVTLLTLLALMAASGCSGRQTADADITDTNTNATSTTAPTFDSGVGYVPIGDPTIDNYCGVLSELDNNTILRNLRLPLHLRVTVLLGTFDKAVPVAPPAVLDDTTKLRDFLSDAAKINAADERSASEQFIQLAQQNDLSPALNDFLAWVRTNCKMSLDIDPTSGSSTRIR